MNRFLRQSTASQARIIGPFVDDTDFKTPETGLTIANTDVKLMANGGSSANKNSGGGTHRVNGMYAVTFDATDSATVGELQVSVVVSGALPVFTTFWVLEEAVYDALFAASAPGYLQPATAGRQLVVDAAGLADANMVKMGPSGSGTAQTARNIGASVLLSAGTGTGQLDFTSGVVKANLAQILGTALTETSGQIAAAFKKFFNIATPASTMDALTLVATATTLTNSPSDSAGVTTLLSRLSATRAGYLDNLSAGAVATASALTAVAGDVTTLLGRITSSLFSGITSLAQWLGAMAGKQTGNSTARTEIRATGAGSGTFDETTDSQEALRDRGDSAWATATGFASASALATADGKLDTLTTRLGAPADFGGGQSIAENLQDIVGSPTFDASTDSLEALRNRGDSAWTTADVSGLATSSALATVDSVVDAIKTTTDKLDDTLEDNSGTYRFTDDALAEAPTGGSAPTAGEIADAVWDEDLSGHTTDGSAGDTLGSVATGTPPTAAAIADAVLDEALSGHTTAGTLGKAVADTLTDAAAILADTGTSGVVVAAGSKTGFALTSAYDAAKTAAQAGDKMDLVDAPNATAIAAIQDGLSTQASVDDLPTNAELATALAGADDAVLAAIAALHNLSASDVRTAIGLASANLDTQLSTIAGYLDTEIASIISTLSTIGTAVTAIKAKSDNLPSDPADQSAVEAAIASAQSTITAAIDALNDLSAAAAATGILDAADGIETGLTLRQAMRLVTAASAGKVSGADTSTVTIRNVGDTKDRITATVDESGNRTAVTTDVS